MTDEYLLDTPKIRTFIETVKPIMARNQPVPDRLKALRPHFSRLMADPKWLPAEFRRAENSGMGGGIATWLLYRAADGSLSFFALVVPPGSSTPVHDHLAWGLVGLYVGEQDEEIYERVKESDPPAEDQATLRLVTRQALTAGSFYELLPPDGDIHRVTTTGDEPSISLHLLGNDTGCVWRHSFDLESGRVNAFRSGYTNRACDNGDQA